jgi:hypothetical protein
MSVILFDLILLKNDFSLVKCKSNKNVQNNFNLISCLCNF